MGAYMFFVGSVFSYRFLDIVGNMKLLDGINMRIADVCVASFLTFRTILSLWCMLQAFGVSCKITIRLIC